MQRCAPRTDRRERRKKQADEVKAPLETSRSHRRRRGSPCRYTGDRTARRAARCRSNSYTPQARRALERSDKVGAFASDYAVLGRLRHNGGLSRVHSVSCSLPLVLQRSPRAPPGEPASKSSLFPLISPARINAALRNKCPRLSTPPELRTALKNAQQRWRKRNSMERAFRRVRFAATSSARAPAVCRLIWRCGCRRAAPLLRTRLSKGRHSVVGG